MEILRLQSEVDNVQKLMAKGRKISELRITGETLQLHQICKHTQLICCFLSFFFFFKCYRDKNHLRQPEETAAAATETTGGSRLHPGTNE